MKMGSEPPALDAGPGRGWESVGTQRARPGSRKLVVGVTGEGRAPKLGSLSLPRWARVLAGAAKALGNAAHRLGYANLWFAWPEASLGPTGTFQLPAPSAGPGGRFRNSRERIGRAVWVTQICGLFGPVADAIGTKASNIIF